MVVHITAFWFCTLILEVYHPSRMYALFLVVKAASLTICLHVFLAILPLGFSGLSCLVWQTSRKRYFCFHVHASLTQSRHKVWPLEDNTHSYDVTVTRGGGWSRFCQDSEEASPSNRVRNFGGIDETSVRGDALFLVCLWDLSEGENLVYLLEPKQQCNSWQALSAKLCHC